MANFELIYQRGPFGDETSLYKLQINKENYTIHELIQDAVAKKNEWGSVEVLVGAQRYVLEYKWGSILEDHIPPQLRTAIIDKETATAHGGWSLMNYIVRPVLNKKELRLVLTYHWYDMIEAGEKPEEYRDLTEFYRSRLEGRHYDIVTFYRGYAKNRKTMSFKYGGYRVGTGQEKWGAVPGKQYYVIKLGERL